MSAELIGVVLTGLGIVITLGLGMLSGFARMVRRIDAVDAKLSARIDAVDSTLSDRIDAGDAKLSARIDRLEDTLSARIDGLEAELTEVKIAIARLEGPRPHLILGR